MTIKCEYSTMKITFCSNLQLSQTKSELSVKIFNHLTEINNFPSTFSIFKNI